MRLLEKQQLFSRLVAYLLWYAYKEGYQVTLGDAYRDHRLHGAPGEKKGYGKSWSNHKSRLAIDLNLFKDGRYLRQTSDHAQLGEYWENLHPLCVWGGRFNDGNHYSLEHQGRH